MLLTRHGFIVFNEYDLGATLESQLNKVKNEIKKDLETNSPSDQLAYINEKVASHKIEPLAFDDTRITMQPSKQMIPAEYFPNSFFVRSGQQYEKEVLTFYLPFTGDKTLLKCVPSTRILWTEDVAIEGNSILFDVINYSNNSDEIKRKRDEVVRFLKKQAENVNSQVNGFNDNLTKEIEDAIYKTIGAVSEHAKFLAELGTPLKEDDVKSSHSLKNLTPPTKVSMKETKKYDVFICHASEDKGFVANLAETLKNSGLEVWYDNFQVGWGDDLRPAIDNGLLNSSYGLVVFSKSFLRKKRWTEYELNGLFSKEKQGKKVILPIWHDIEKSDLEEYSPTFADRIALSSSSISKIVTELKKLLSK